eukprot:6214183-Amphidinium_carterae.1
MSSICIRVKARPYDVGLIVDPVVFDLPATEDKNAYTNHCTQVNTPHTSSTSRSQNTIATSAETHPHQCT